MYPDYLNVDKRVGVGVDLVADIRSLEFIPDCIDEVLLQDVLEHLSLIEARELLHKLHRWMKAGGVVSISTPNMRVLARNLCSSDCHESLKWIFGADGSSGHVEPLFHHWGYSRYSLSTLLEGSGFGVLECFTDCFGFRLCVIAQKNGEIKK